MKVPVITLFAFSAMWAADDERLARALKAQADFDRVELAPLPKLRDAATCVQSQASVLPVSSREELPLIHFRKGYCALASGALTGNRTDFTDAAGEFDQAIESWPARYSKNTKAVPEPVSAGLRVLSAVATLKAGGISEAQETEAYNEIARAAQTHACPASLMPVAFCDSIVNVGRRWVAWIALQDGRTEEAGRILAGLQGTALGAWTAGREAFRDRKFEEAAAHYKSAVEIWEKAARDEERPLLDRLSPQPDLAEAHADLGGAQLLAGDTTAAISTLNTAVREAPDNARPLYLRARAKELAGDREAALADYNLASRTAFAGAKDLASGEAHLYRGILLYRRRDYSRAENEFASALNFEIPPRLRGDASAWRHLSAVAEGDCEASRPMLERALADVSPYFPKEEARTTMAACATEMSAGRQGPEARR